MAEPAVPSGGRTRAQRIVKALIVLVALGVSGVAALFVVAAGLFHIKYAEPDPELAKRFALAVRAADGSIDLATVHEGAWDSVSVIGPFTGLEAVQSCIGVAGWDQDGALADHLNQENQSALVIVSGGAVSAATWSIWQQLPFEVPNNLCAVPQAEAVFRVATRDVQDPKAGRVAVYRLEPAP